MPVFREMRRLDGREAGRGGEWLDLAGLVLLAVVAAILVLLALFGFSVGLAAWPFAVGAVMGDALMYLAMKLERYRTPILILALFLMVTGFVMLLDFGAGYRNFQQLNPQLPWEIPAAISKLFIGMLVGFGGLVFTGYLWSVESWDTAVMQRRQTVREVLIVGGMFAGFVLLVLLLAGFVALVAWIAINFG